MRATCSFESAATFARSVSLNSARTSQNCFGVSGASSYRRSSGALLSIFKDRLRSQDRFVGVRIDDKEDVYPALKEFFGKRGEDA